MGGAGSYCVKHCILLISELVALDLTQHTESTNRLSSSTQSMSNSKAHAMLVPRLAKSGGCFDLVYHVGIVLKQSFVFLYLNLILLNSAVILCFARN